MDDENLVMYKKQKLKEKSRGKKSARRQGSLAAKLEAGDTRTISLFTCVKSSMAFRK